MKVQILICVLVGFTCFAAVSAARRAGGDPLLDLRVYRIDSRLVDGGVLTANRTNIPNPHLSNRTIIATTEPKNDSASQKWRLDGSALYNSFELHPTSNEDFNLEYDPEGNFFYWIASWGFGYNKNWYLVDAGDGYSMIKNHYNKVCISSAGMNKALQAEECNNSIAQQWKFVLLE